MQSDAGHLGPRTCRLGEQVGMGSETEVLVDETGRGALSGRGLCVSRRGESKVRAQVQDGSRWRTGFGYW